MHLRDDRSTGGYARHITRALRIVHGNGKRESQRIAVFVGNGFSRALPPGNGLAYVRVGDQTGIDFAQDTE